MVYERANVVGLILLFLGTIAAGVGLTIGYYHFMPTVVEYHMYLALALTAVFGITLAILVGIMTKIFRVTGLKPAIILVIIACVIFTYFKWAFYLEVDAKVVFEDKAEKDYWFKVFEDFNCKFVDEDGKALESSQLGLAISAMTLTDAEKYIKEFKCDCNCDRFKDIELTEAQKKMTYWKYRGYDKHFNGSESVVINQVETMIDSSAFSYYRIISQGEDDTPSWIDFALNPMGMLNIMGQINTEERWTFDEDFEGEKSDNLIAKFPVAFGGIELLLIFLPAIIVTIKRVSWNDRTGYARISVQKKMQERAVIDAKNEQLYGEPKQMESVGGRKQPQQQPQHSQPQLTQQHDPYVKGQYHAQPPMYPEQPTQTAFAPPIPETPAAPPPPPPPPPPPISSPSATIDPAAPEAAAVYFEITSQGPIYYTLTPGGPANYVPVGQVYVEQTPQGTGAYYEDSPSGKIYFQAPANPLYGHM